MIVPSRRGFDAQGLPLMSCVLSQRYWLYLTCLEGRCVFRFFNNAMGVDIGCAWGLCLPLGVVGNGGVVIAPSSLFSGIPCMHT